MALVDYGSDSDSDSAPTPAPPLPSKPATSNSLSSSLGALLPKPKHGVGPVTIVSSSGARKIIVSLPKAEGRDPGVGDDEPPNKRARIGVGSGLGGGLASMLPAPKKRVQNGAGRESETESGTGAETENETGGGGDSGSGEVAVGAVGLGAARKGRVLGGGAARREDMGLVVMPEEAGGWNGGGDGDVAGPRLGEGEKDAEVNQPPQKPVTQFMPQSVARRIIQPMSSFRKKKTPGPGGGAGGRPASTAPVLEKLKPKVSLFSAVTEPMPTPSANPGTEYKPLLVSSAPAPPEPTPQLSSEEYDPNLTYQTHSQPSSSPNSLESIAQAIGLDDAAMRQLLGRQHRGRNNIPDISEIATFDVNTEYKSNTLLARSEEAQRVASVNPVRSIAPGKHQLTQLLNAAQQQKGALEEAFAEGKRNRKEAGGKYGW